MSKLIIIAVGAFSLATASHAQTAISDLWRVEASGGYTLLKAEGGGRSVDLDALTARIGARHGRHLGLEVEGSLGVDQANVGGIKVKLDAQTAVYAVGYLPVTRNAELFGRLGFGAAKLKGWSNGVKASDSHSTWNVGVGGQYHLDAHNGVRLEYTRLNSFNGGNLDTVSASYVYSF